MPGMSGYEATERLRQLLGRRIPIIAMTANATREDRNRCLKAGMDDFLPKPFGRAALNDILCKWLRPEATPADASLTDKLAMLPVLDATVFDELWANLRWQTAPMQRIRETFLATARRTLSLLADIRDAGLSRELHTLLGSSGMIGARYIERLAAELQTAVRQNLDVAGMRELLERAIFDFDRAFDRRLSTAAERT
jgi:CheY-like chemotaxis protein